MPTRRRLLKGIGASGLLVPVAGCSGGDAGSADTTTEETTTEPTTEEETTTATTTEESGPVTVAVGPEKKPRYDPETIEISDGETLA